MEQELKCYGFTRNNSGELILNQDALNVFRVFSLHLSGASLQAIADELERNNVLSPLGKERRSSAAIKKILLMKCTLIGLRPKKCLNRFNLKSRSVPIPRQLKMEL